jgi:RNA polymerase sigma-70 factor, ECF subfamily
VEDNTNQSPEDLVALFPLLYRELRNRPGQLVEHEVQNQSLQATALVHEAYLKLARNNRGVFRNRGQRSSLVELPAMTLAVVSTDPQLEIALNEALERFQAMDARRARIVELKFFAGLSNEETADALGNSISTVKQDWALARAWLHRELT